MPIEDIPARPDPDFANLGLILADLGREGIDSAAMLLSRPGPRAMTDDDLIAA